MKTKKAKNGISLMVLVITIVVMIILAGVVIITLDKTNIIDKAKKAKKDSDLSSIREMIKVANANSLIDDDDALLQNVYEKISKQGVETKKVAGSGVTVSNISLSKSSVNVDKSGTAVINLTTNDTSVPVTKYYVILDGQAYELIQKNSIVDISDTPSDMSGVEVPEIEVTGQNYSNVAIDQTNKKITITGGNYSGIDTLKVKYGEKEATLTARVGLVNGKSIISKQEYYDSLTSDFSSPVAIYSYSFKSDIASAKLWGTHYFDVAFENVGLNKWQNANDANIQFMLNNKGQIMVKQIGNLSEHFTTFYAAVNFEVILVNGDVITDTFVMQYGVSCLVSGTLIEVEEEEEDKNGNKKKVRKKKKIEDLTYDDKLVVWNFDEGKFDVSRPLWLMRKHIVNKYNLLKFSDGSELKTVDQHRIFNKELGKFTYPMTDETPIGTTTFNKDGKEVKLVEKTVVKERVEYYNLISYYHMNAFANGILTSCRFNNLYKIENMKFVKEERENVAREEYALISDEYYYGLRLTEQPKEINRGNDVNHANSVEEHIINVYMKTDKKND